MNGVKIACVLPHTNPGYEGRARAQRLAVQLALADAQAASLLPVAVELVNEDDGYVHARTVEIARRLAADPSVVAVVGPPSTEMVVPSGPVYHEAGLAHIATAATNTSLSRNGWRTFFRLVATDAQHCRDVAAFAARVLGKRRVSIAHDNSVWGRGLAAGVRDALVAASAEVPAVVETPERASRDYADFAAAIAASRPDLVFLAEHETVANPLAVAIRQAGVLVPFFGPNGLKPFPHLSTFDYPVEGPYYTNVIGDAAVKPAIQAMTARYAAKFGEEPTLYAAEAYDAAGVILDALRRAGPSATRESVLRAIKATRDYPGITGPVAFDERGDAVVREIGIYEVEGRERKFLGFVNELLAASAAR